MREMETINIKKEPNKLLEPKTYYIWDFKNSLNGA